MEEDQATAETVNLGEVRISFVFHPSDTFLLSTFLLVRCREESIDYYLSPSHDRNVIPGVKSRTFPSWVYALSTRVSELLSY